MNKNTYETVKLPKGEMHVYNFGAARLHAYSTCSERTKDQDQYSAGLPSQDG